MKAPRAHDKLEETQFFLDHLREEKQKEFPNWPKAFRFYLSAFLNAAYSLTQWLEREAKTQLKEGAEHKKREKAKFNDWLNRWIDTLPPKDRKVWDLMEQQRRLEVHELGAKTVPETKAVPIMRDRRGSSYFLPIMFVHPPFLDAAQLEERRRRGLPVWAEAWWEAQIHHFEIEGERRDVVQTSERYVALLQRLLDDFENSELAKAQERRS